MKKLLLEIAVCCGIGGIIIENASGMVAQSNRFEALDKNHKKSSCLSSSEEEIEVALKRLSAPTPETREKLRKYKDFFIDDDKYPMPSTLWNWSVGSDKNMEKALEVGRFIKEGLVPDVHDSIFDDFEDFYSANDDKADAIACKFVKNCAELEFKRDSIGAIMQRLYTIADDLYLSGKVKKSAIELYERTYARLVDYSFTN